MGQAHQVAISVLAFSPGVGAFRCPGNPTLGGGVQKHVIDSDGNGAKSSHRRRRWIAGHPALRVSTAVMMVSEREEDLKVKIARLRGVAAKGDTYERVVGSGADLKDKMEQTTRKLTNEERVQEEEIRQKVVMTGDKEKAVSELEAGRRTIVRDEDDPEMEANPLDGLMVSRVDDFEEELRAAYMPADSELRGRGGGKKFDGGFASTIEGAEAFFNKPSPFQKAARYKAQEEATTGSTAGIDLAADAIDGAETAVEAAGEVMADAMTGKEASGRLTGSVGGRWEKAKEGVEVDTHKPVVSTWGVFERPKDISKAFGGGRDPTLRKTDPEEAKRREEATEALLRSYRGVSDADLEKERSNEKQIKEALAVSKRAMKFGDTFGAVSALEAIKQDCSTNGPLGAVVFLELAMALEVTGRSYQAQDIYKVLKRSKNREVRAQAKRLNEGLEAMDMLNMGRPGEVQEESEISKMWTSKFQQMSGDKEKKYDAVYFDKDLDGRPKASSVFAVEDAKEVLMFASKYRGGVSSSRIINAFEFLKKRSEEAVLAAKREAAALKREEAQLPPASTRQPTIDETPDGGDNEAANENLEGKSLELKRRRPPWERKTESAFPKGGAGLMSLMGDASSLEQRVQGGWNLVIKAGGSKVEVLRRDSSLVLSPGGSATAVEPAGPLSVAKEGQWEMDANDRMVKLDFKSSKWVGLVDLGGGQENLEVLALDDKLLVASESLRSAAAGAPTVNYRLLVRQ